MSNKIEADSLFFEEALATMRINDVIENSELPIITAAYVNIIAAVILEFYERIYLFAGVFNNSFCSSVIENQKIRFLKTFQKN